MSTPRASVSIGTITMPPPSPVSEPSKPATNALAPIRLVIAMIDTARSALLVADEQRNRPQLQHFFRCEHWVVVLEEEFEPDPLHRFVVDVSLQRFLLGRRCAKAVHVHDHLHAL